jgi:hypothetical protein
LPPAMPPEPLPPFELELELAAPPVPGGCDAASFE